MLIGHSIGLWTITIGTPLIGALSVLDTHSPCNPERRNGDLRPWRARDINFPQTNHANIRQQEIDMAHNMKAFYRTGTIFIAAPTTAQRPINGGCSCDYCKANPGSVPMWDTIAVAASKPDHAWMVHYPEFANS
jgi:hypothetical protein